MASKNTIALFLTINLVLFGFTVAQPQTCPRDSQACSTGYAISLQTLNDLALKPCCTLVAGLDASVASVCICDALIYVGLTNPINVGLGHVLSFCGAASLPPGFTCA